MAIGNGAPREEKSYLVLDGRHLAKDGQRVKHSDPGAGWRSMAGSPSRGGHFYPKLMFPLFKYPTMARLFTAMTVGGQKQGL